MQIIYYKRKQQPLIFKLALPYSSDISNTRILRALWASWLRPLCLRHSGRVTHAPPSIWQASELDGCACEFNDEQTWTLHWKYLITSFNIKYVKIRTLYEAGLQGRYRQGGDGAKSEAPRKLIGQDRPTHSWQELPSWWISFSPFSSSSSASMHCKEHHCTTSSWHDGRWCWVLGGGLGES